jgi:hypothetical protein
VIVGSGAIAGVLHDRDDRLYFASGVADSKEVRDSEFNREADLLRSQQRYRHIVYFSSLCVFTSDTMYARHKRNMESLIKDFPCYTIMRLGNADWATNRCQLIPFIKEKILNRESFPVFDEYRHVLTEDEFLYWVDRIPVWNCEMNITGTRMKVAELVFKLKEKYGVM